MAVSLATSIAVPIANKQTHLTFTATTGNFVRLWCTAAPVGSKLRTKLDVDVSARVHVLDADSARQYPYTFEVAGAYQFAATELTKGAAPYGGGYQTAPNSAPAEIVLGETALTLFVASRLTATMGIGGDTANLVLYVADTTIRQTTLAVQGEATPAIEKPKTDKASTAAGNAGLLAALALLAGVNAATSLGDLSALATDFIDKFNAHVQSSVFHYTGDISANVIPSAFRNPANAEALKRALAIILRSLSAHIRNDSASAPVGTGALTFHVISTVGVVDWASMPLFESTSTISEHVRGLADAHRAFESHRPAAAHLVPDNTNVLTALSPLLNVHALFLAGLANLSPPAPVTDNSAKTVLVHGAGFQEL